MSEFLTPFLEGIFYGGIIGVLSYCITKRLLRSLEQNGWKNTSAVKSDTPRTDALLDDQKFDNVDFDTSCQQLAELCRELERELNEAKNKAYNYEQGYHIHSLRADCK